jgi:hypothetical protein
MNQTYDLEDIFIDMSVIRNESAFKVEEIKVIKASDFRLTLIKFLLANQLPKTTAIKL